MMEDVCEADASPTYTMAIAADAVKLFTFAIIIGPCLFVSAIASDTYAQCRLSKYLACCLLQ